MHKTIQKRKNEIRENFYSGAFKRTIELCKSLIKKLKKIYYDNFQDIKQEICFCNYYIGKSFLELKSIKQSIRYAKKAISIGLNKYYEENSLVTESRILLAEDYKRMNRINKSVKNYKRCSKYYKSIQSNENRRQMVFEIAKLRSNPNIMTKIIEMDEKENNDISNEEITEKYIDLIDYYLKLNNLKEVASIICNIKDIQVKIQVANALKDLVPKIA